METNKEDVVRMLNEINRIQAASDQLRNETDLIKKNIQRMKEAVEETDAALTAYIENEDDEKSEMLYNKFTEVLEKSKATVS